MKTRSVVILALLVAATATVGSAAYADTCPTPSLVQCRDPAYLGTACGQQSVANESSTCSTQLRAAYQAETQKPDVTVEEVMVPQQPGVTTAAASKKYSYFNHFGKNTSFPGEFMGVEQKSQLAVASNGQVNLFGDSATRLGLGLLKTQTDAWTANGNQVRSCAEYTHEKFRGYTQWKDLADVSLASDEVLFQKAYDPTVGIANKTLKSKSGLSNLPSVQFPSNGQIGTIIVGGQPQPIMDPKSPKNGFFKGYKSLAKGSFFKPADAALKQKLMAAQGQSHHITDWNYHKQMHDTLTPSYDDETLRHYEDLQADYLRLVAQREEVLTLIAKYGTIWTTPQASRDLGAELAALEASIRSELQQADAVGCLDAVNPSRCDWSQRQLRDQVGGFYSKHMEAAFQKCIENTSDDFGSTSLVRNAGMFNNNQKQDYTGTAEDVDQFQGVVANWISQQSFPVDEKGKPFLGDRKSDSGVIGSGELSLDWSYDVGWAVENLTKEGDECKAGLKANGSFKAVGHAYGTDVNVIDANTELTAVDSVGKAKVKLTVLDNVVWNRWDDPYTQELSAGLAKEFKSGTSKNFSTTIYPFGIPVTLSAGVGMSVGLKVNAKAAVASSQCTVLPSGTATIELASVNGTITPWAQADAMASAAIGIPGFQAGIKCNIVIVRGEMPMTANAKITVNSSRQVNASASFVGKQQFRMLDGTIKAFVDGPFDFMDSEWTVFSWQGPKIDQEIFRFEKSTMPLNQMKQALPPTGGT